MHGSPIRVRPSALSSFDLRGAGQEATPLALAPRCELKAHGAIAFPWLHVEEREAVALAHVGSTSSERRLAQPGIGSNKYSDKHASVGKTRFARRLVIRLGSCPYSGTGKGAMNEKSIRKKLEARIKELRSEARQLEHVVRKLGSGAGRPSKARRKAIGTKSP